MKRRTVFWLGAFAALIVGGSARAQATSRRPAAKPARTGTAQSAPPAQPVVVNTTGFPTANVDLEGVSALAHGEYAADGLIEGEAAFRRAAVTLGGVILAQWASRTKPA